jgi:hypothetical protein
MNKETVFQIYSSSPKELSELHEKLVEHCTYLRPISKQLPNGLVRLIGATKKNLKIIKQLVNATLTCTLSKC